jgi:hypothetical protein
VSTDSAAAQSFLLQRAQPAMTGLIDGSLSTLAPIVAIALATHAHTLPFLIPQYPAAMLAAVVTIAFELLALSWIRWRFSWS